MTLREFVALARGDVEVNRRLAGSLSVLTVLVFRLGSYGHRGRGPIARLAGVAARLLDLVWIKLLVGADIPATLECGPRLCLPHAGRGVFINEGAVIGSDVTIMHQVTIGNVHGEPTAPVIGSHTEIGAKASVLGAVTLGENSRVGAHAVVLHDVPDGATALGVPAKVRQLT